MKLGSLLSSVMVAGLLIGCGGSGGSGYPTSTGNNGGNNGTPPVGPAAGNVSIIEYGFAPDTVTIKAGAMVTWTNDGTVAHTATADGGAFDSGQLSAPGGGGLYGGGTSGGTFSFTFSTAGTYDFHCANHPTQMKGTVIVTP